MNEIFQRTERLLGAENTERIAQLRVIVFGVGGVGSWCAEALLRSGVRRLTIVDSDCVSVTNVNRQLMATTRTVGRPKVEVLRERLMEINPEAEVKALQMVYNSETASEFHLETEYDCVVDAIDSLEHKANLILHATRCQGVRLYSAMGAALKMDPTRIRVAEFWKVQGCPLAKALRNKFKRNRQFPSHKFQCVYSEELLPNLGDAPSPDPTDTFSGIRAQVNGSLCHEVGIYGFTLAGLVIRDTVNIQ